MRSKIYLLALAAAFIGIGCPEMSTTRSPSDSTAERGDQAVACGVPLLGNLIELGVAESPRDLHITEETVWRDATYRVHGNIYLEAGGKLVLDHAALELMNQYQNQYTVIWKGGELVTQNGSYIGGTNHGGAGGNEIFLSYVMIENGSWTIKDTTIDNWAGTFAGSGGVIDATNVKKGCTPDWIGPAVTTDPNNPPRITVRDSVFDFVVRYSMKEGGSYKIDLPVGAPVDRTFGASGTTGDYTMTLKNVTAKCWWLGVEIANDTAPPGELLLDNAPCTLAAITGTNLVADMQLPVKWNGTKDAFDEHPDDLPAALGPVPIGTRWKTGNVTWAVGSVPAGIESWSAYPQGAGTDLTFRGPSKIAEILVAEGNVRLLGSEGTHDLMALALFFDVGGGSEPATMTLNRVNLGYSIPGTQPDDSIDYRADLAASAGATVLIDDARGALLRLRAVGDGKIVCSGTGLFPESVPVEFVESGGSIVGCLR